MVNLYPKREFKVPIFAECINPEIFEDKTLSEIAELEVWEGNKRKKLGEFFKIEEVKAETEEPTITLYGDLSRIKRIGAKMRRGIIKIQGDVGMHLGEEMEGGKIVVRGNVDSWAGSMMKGGIIEIYGNASHYLGAPYRGSTVGMRGGRIIVHGNAGNEVGAYMRKGIIKVYGNVGQFVGLRMRKGTIFVAGDAEGRMGACMKGGKIIVCGHVDSILPSFTIENVKGKVKVEADEIAQGPFYLFLGDLTENGMGKLYVSKEKNPHLGFYEKYL